MCKGASSESTLPPNDWAIISSKLKQIGGLYIYKDNIRILPYGTNDYDFLDIERNRNKKCWLLLLLFIEGSSA